MAEYKLTYYNITGLAEPIRYMFAIAGVAYEDNRIPKDDTTYPVLPSEIKDKLPWGQMPLLEVNGKKLSQSSAIGRFIARKFKLAGADDFESAKCDEIVDAIKDFGQEWRPVMSEQDDGKKLEMVKKLKEEKIPKFMGKLNRIIEENGGKWLVGANVTWTDLVLAHYVTLLSNRVKIDLASGFPLLENLIKSVYAIPQVKEWMVKRPQTE